MCALCGMLGGQDHWTDTASNPESFGARSQTHTRHRERQDRMRLINRIVGHYGLSVSDWSGNAYVVRSATGRTLMADNLSQVWTAASTITGKSCDPLDPALIRAIRAGSGPAGR